MKTTFIGTLVTLAVVGAASAELTDLETKYLKGFANYTGGMGIELNPEDTYDCGFRQTVLKSKDEELQRAFILQKLPRQISLILEDLGQNRTMVGKGEYCEMTPHERTELIQSFEECMSLLKKLDSNNHDRFLKHYRKAFETIQKQRGE